MKLPQNQSLVVDEGATRLRHSTPDYPATFFLSLADATPHPKWGEAVTVVTVTDLGTTEEDIVAACRGSLAPYKIPKRIVFVDEGQWSVTPTGKINRKAMRETALLALGLADQAS